MLCGARVRCRLHPDICDMHPSYRSAIMCCWCMPCVSLMRASCAHGSVLVFRAIVRCAMAVPVCAVPMPHSSMVSRRASHEFGHNCNELCPRCCSGILCNIALCPFRVGPFLSALRLHRRHVQHHVKHDHPVCALLSVCVCSIKITAM
jgi:hypothetical protein